MKKSHFVRSLAVLACMLGLSTGLCLANPVVAEAGWGSNNATTNSGSGGGWGSSNAGTSSAWSKSDCDSAGSSWGNSNSNCDSAGSSWGNSNSNSDCAGSPWGSSNSNCDSTGSSWGNSNSNSGSNSGGTSWASSNSGNTHQQSHISMPDPLTQISSGTLRGIIEQCRGKVVLLNFFASWCGPCRQEIPSLKALRNKFSDDDLVIISVSVDENRADLEAMRNEVQFNYPTLWASTELKQAYNLQSIPRIIIYDREGYTVTDDTGMVEQSALFNFMEAIVNY